MYEKKAAAILADYLKETARRNTCSKYWGAMRKVIHELRGAIKYTLFLTLSTLTFGVQALSPSQVFNKVKDSVVVVKTLDAKGEMIAQGSGVLLPSGKIGTNCHVIENGASFQVGSGKRFVRATLWGGDEDKDLCLLEGTALTAKPAQLGRATHLKVGEPVYAVGAPRGLELSLSNGIVSQLRGGEPPFVQTTAAISPGSSGGGLFDAEGRLVGFTTLYIEGAQSLNFAMPVEWVGGIQPGKKLAQGRSEADWAKRTAAFEVAKNWAGMRDWCTQWTEAQPRNNSAWLHLSTALRKLQLYTEAIEAARRAVQINPENSWSWAVLGATYHQLQRYSEAIEPLREAIRINPENADAWGMLSLVYDGLKRYTEAVDAARQAIRLDPNTEVWFALGQAYLQLQRYTEAIDAFHQTIRINPEFAEAWVLLAISYEQMGNRTAALETVKQLRRLDSSMADKLFDMMVPR